MSAQSQSSKQYPMLELVAQTMGGGGLRELKSIQRFKLQL